MAVKTGVVRISPARNRVGHTTIRGAMTTAALRADRDMLRMIEPVTKTAQCRKRFYSSLLRIFMTDRANRSGATSKLRRMTAGARRVIIFSW